MNQPLFGDLYLTQQTIINMLQNEMRHTVFRFWSHSLFNLLIKNFILIQLIADPTILLSLKSWFHHNQATLQDDVDSIHPNFQ